MKKETSCTSLPNSWLAPSMRSVKTISALPACEIDFTSAKKRYQVQYLTPFISIPLFGCCIICFVDIIFLLHVFAPILKLRLLADSVVDL